MSKESPDISALNTNDSAAQPKAEAPIPAQPFAEQLNYEWYIRIKAEFRGASLPQFKSKIVLETQERVAELHEGLKSRLSGYEIQNWPQRLLASADVQNEKLYTCYWLIGLPSMPSADLSNSRKFLKEWQDEPSKSQAEGVKKTVQAKFIPRKVFLEQDLKEDLSLLPTSNASPEPKENRRAGARFKKKAGSNPAQIRKQFLQHAMGGDPASAYPQQSTGKLRPPKDVLNRLKFDAGYDLEEYIVGYIDRQAGILEKPVVEWQDYEEMELIAYFKHMPEDLVVWDRARKVDWIFNPRPS